MELVSVVVPIYNVEKYICECIDSILKQTYEYLEIILVDDGSPDNCSKICDEYARRDNRIIVIHKENGGLSSARNAGINVATGKYIIFVDSDDTILLDMIQVLVRVAEEKNAEIVSCGITSDLKKLELNHSEEIRCVNVHDALKLIFSEKEMTTSASGKLYLRQLWENITFPEKMIYEDLATVYKVIMVCDEICIIPENKYYYRPNDKGITGGGFSKKKLQYFEVTDMVRTDIEKTYPDLVENIDDRATRYAISFFKEISKSGFREKKVTDYLLKVIRKNIKKYIYADYSIYSKCYGLLISIAPHIAINVFRY